MKRIVFAVMATISGLVLLFTYRTSLEAAPLTADAAGSTTTGSGTTSSGATGSGTTNSGTTGSGTTGSGTGTSGSGSGTSAGSGLADGQFTGDAVNTRYGPVQVQITVSGGAITVVDVPQYPQSNGRDQQINGYAIPRLVSETTSAQSAQIDMISGATYTSQGYIQSLQSALDQARG